MQSGGRPSWEKEVADDCEVLGLPRDAFAAAIKETDEFEIWPENEQALNMAAGLSTQWRIAAGWSGERKTGLDYSAVEALMRMMRVPVRDRFRLLLQIRTFEQVVLGQILEGD